MDEYPESASEGDVSDGDDDGLEDDDGDHDRHEVGGLCDSPEDVVLLVEFPGIDEVSNGHEHEHIEHERVHPAWPILIFVVASSLPPRNDEAIHCGDVWVGLWDPVFSDEDHAEENSQLVNRLDSDVLEHCLLD